MLGISVYFQDLDYEYLKEASKNGAKYIFTSLHIPEEDYSDLDQKMPKFIETTRNLGLEIVPDISPVTFEKLNIEKNDYQKLKELGFKSLRLDYGFDNFDVVKQLQKDFYLMLNASVINEKYLIEARENGVDFDKIAVTHNFYPRQNTGLNLEYFIEKNRVFHKYGLKIQAFVCGDDLKRFPLYEGLPTIEKHRGINPYVAAVELIKKGMVDDVFIGDSKAKIETLANINRYMHERKMVIKCILEEGYEHLYDQELKPRRDMSENVVRLNIPRKAGVPICHNVNKIKGSIVMENQLSGRYSGELQIIKNDLGFEARSNVIGYVHPEYIDIIDYIDGDTIVIFQK